MIIIAQFFMAFKSSKIKSPFWRSLFAPFEAFFFHKLEFFIWFAFVLVASLFGIIINLVKRCCFNGWDFQAALGPDSVSGSFYTFSMVMLSSLIYPLFVRFLKSEKPEYRKIHIAYITVLIFTMLLCGVFYSFSTIEQPVVDYARLQNIDMELDLSQFIFFILTLFFSAYSFGLTLIGNHEDELHLSDDYLEEENKSVKMLSETSMLVEQDVTTPQGTHLNL